MSQVTFYKHFDPTTIATGGGTTQGMILFFLPLGVGVLGLFGFLLIGILLIKYYRKEPEVNTIRYDPLRY